MTQHDELKLTSATLGPLPLIQHFLDKLDVDGILAQYVPANDRRFTVPPAAVLGVLLRNILVGRAPLYGLAEWTAGFHASVLPLRDHADALNDDRAGRALDYLFDADRASILTALTVRAIRAFSIDLDQLHNDSTSISFSGSYALASGRRIRGKQALAITHGHSKDHRPDLKQILWILTVSADGSVPVHYRCCNGNTNDDPTHIETWEALRTLAGKATFLYVADSKLCVRKNLDHIHNHGGRFICVLPRTRKEDAWFRKHIQDHVPTWEVAVNRSPASFPGTPDVWSAVASPSRSAEGYRIIWLASDRGAERARSARSAMIRKACDGIEELNKRIRGPKTRFRDRPSVVEAADKIIDSVGAQRWVSAVVAEEKEESYHQAAPGRPSPNTKYVKTERIRYSVAWKENDAAIAYDARSDGMYPLITNCEDLTPSEILLRHKYQPTLEKRHEQLKSVYAVAPAFLKNEGRIEALLLLYYLALLIQALVERQLRRGMKGHGLQEIPLYPEERDCKAPTARRVFDIFANLQRHELWEGGVRRRAFEPELTPIQRQVLELLDVPETVFAGSKDGPQG